MKIRLNTSIIRNGVLFPSGSLIEINPGEIAEMQKFGEPERPAPAESCEAAQKSAEAEDKPKKADEKKPTVAKPTKSTKGKK